MVEVKGILTTVIADIASLILAVILNFSFSLIVDTCLKSNNKINIK